MKSSSLYVIVFTSVFVIYIAAQMQMQRPGCVLQAVPGYLNKFTIHRSILGYSKEFWCANGTIFDQDTCSCVLSTDPSVMFTAPPPTQPSYPTDGTGQVIRTTTEKGCTFKPDNDRMYYQEYTYARGWLRRLCPEGTLYNEEMCLCVDMAPISSAICRPQLFLDFNNKVIADVAGTNIYIGNKGVDSIEGAGRFNRQGKLHIPMYANAGFGDKLTIAFRFYDFPGGDDEQVLASNCHNSQLGSIEIIMSPRNQEVIFRVDTSRSEPKEISVPYPQNAWKNVTMTYDGTYLTGRVNQEENRVMAKGNIVSRSGNQGLSIGQCAIRRDNKRAFVGYIDDFKIHRCVQNGGYFSQGGFMAATPA